MSATDSGSASLRDATTTVPMRARRSAGLVTFVALGIALSGCASAPASTPSAPSAPPLVEPPPPPVNLQGFPLAYRQGFGDGCSTARGVARRDSARQASDGNYRTGWQDGLAQCHAR